MTTTTSSTPHYIVQVASAPVKSSWKWQHPRRRVAVLEVEPGVERVSMISTRARGVRRIVATWECLYVGSSPRCQYEIALAEAEDRAAALNAAAIRNAALAHHAEVMAFHRAA